MSSQEPSNFTPPFSKSADNNKDHILGVLKDCLKSGDVVLEVASGTGQHAVHFTEHLPQITWQTTDVDMAHFGLEQTIAQISRPNLPDPKILDIAAWPSLEHAYDAVYSANCLHIIADELVPPYVAGAARSLQPGGAMMLYGPYKYGGEFTTPSNAQFNTFLTSNYPGGGIKDIETVIELARQNDMELEQDIAMPANNQFLIFRKASD